MTVWIFVIGAVYLLILGCIAYFSWRRTRTSEDYVLA